MEDGGISAQEVADAFRSATEEGGRFNGLSDRLAETMGGKLMIATANLELALTNVGKALGPLVISLTDGMDKGASAIDGVTGAIGMMADGLAFVIALGRDLSEGGGQLAAIFGYGSQEALKNTNELLDLLDKRDAEANQPKSSGFMTDEVAFIQSEINAAATARTTREKEELAMIQRLQMEINVASSERIRKEEQKRMDMENRIARNALQAAEKKFEKERNDAIRLRDEIAKGPGGGIIDDSNEAAKFMADQVNKALASDAVGVPGKPTDEMLLEEARKQYEQALADSKKADEQTELLKKLVEKTQPIGRAR
jgi:hypothetical protein